MKSNSNPNIDQHHLPLGVSKTLKKCHDKQISCCNILVLCVYFCVCQNIVYYKLNKIELFFYYNNDGWLMNI